MHRNVQGENYFTVKNSNGFLLIAVYRSCIHEKSKRRIVR